MTDKIYLIYRREMESNGTVREWITAIIEGETIIGETPQVAKGLLKNLTQDGWPAVSPMTIYRGTYKWAAEVTREELAEMLARAT